MLDEFEITGIVRGKNGNISHCGVKGYGIQNVGLMKKLIMEEACSFFIYVGEEKRKVYVRISNGAIFLTTDPNGYNMDNLNSLPLLDKSFIQRLIDPVR